jgi:hypothetical protein
MAVDEELIARGFWGPRQESPDRVADKLVAFVTGLDEVVGESIPWSSQHLPGKSLAEPVNARQLISDAFRGNTDAPHLGINRECRASGEGGKMFSIGMSVGGYSDSPNVRNALIVKWRGRDVAELADPILCRLVSVWDPDWAAVTSRSLLRALADVQPAGKSGPKIGYLSYLSEGRAEVLPGGVEEYLVRRENGGVVIGSDEGDGFLPVDEVGELARVLRGSAALSATPTSRSKF